MQATAAVATGKKLATQCYGANAKAKKLSGDIASEFSGGGRKWRVRWEDDKIGKPVHSSRVLENADSIESIEDIEDDVVMDERDSDEKLLSEELAEVEPDMEKDREPTSIDHADEYQTALQTSVLDRDHHKQRINLDVLNVFWSVQAENLAA